MSQNNLNYLEDDKINKRIKKILIIGFPHNGTSILKSIIGHIENIYEFIKETDWIPDSKINEDYDKKKNYHYYLCKIPFTNELYFTDKYEDYIKIFILRNPIYCFSSINNRFNYNIPSNTDIDSYIEVLKLFDKYNNNTYKNIYCILYKDLFDNNYYKFKKILDKIGLTYDDTIFNNEKYKNYILTKNIPTNKPNFKDHDNYRTYQINQKFQNFNNYSIINLTDNQILTILENKTLITKYFDIKPLLKIKPIYISIRFMLKNENKLCLTLKSIIEQTLIPNKIFLFLHEESYILDSDIKKIIKNEELINIIEKNNDLIEINFIKKGELSSKNLLLQLPLLKIKYNEDCIIIRMNNNIIYNKNIIENLICDYFIHKCIITYKYSNSNNNIFSVKYSNYKNITYTKKNILYNFFINKEIILYKPNYFHNIIHPYLKER
jgi:hypothetical protein